MGAVLVNRAPAQIQSLVGRFANERRVLNGKVVAIRSKTVYLQSEGAVVPLQAQALHFIHGVTSGQDVKVVFHVEDNQSNVAEQIWASAQGQAALMAG